MKTKIATIIALFCLFATNVSAKQYRASFFGMKSDGVTVNTGSLQKAIDYISTQSPGDTLTIYVGRYLTGGVILKPNVTIQLREGAILVSTVSAYDYITTNGQTALLRADNVENVEIFGQGVVEGNGKSVLSEVEKQQKRGFIPSVEAAKPALFTATNSKNIKLKGIILQNACADAVVVGKCNNINIDNITVFGTETANSKGLVLTGNNGLTVSNCFIETSGKPLEASENVASKILNSKTPTGQKLTF